MNMKMASADSAGLTSGRMIEMNVWNWPQPSISAASM